MLEDPLSAQAHAGQFLASAFSTYVSILAAGITAFGAAWYGARHNETFARKRENRSAFGVLFAAALGYSKFASLEQAYWSSVRSELSARIGRQINDSELWKGVHGTLEAANLPPHSNDSQFGLLVEFGQMELLSELLSLEDACTLIDKCNDEHAKLSREYLTLLSDTVRTTIGPDGLPIQTVLHDEVTNPSAKSLQPELQRLVISRAKGANAAYKNAKVVMELIRHFAGVHQKELGLKSVPVVHL